MSDMPSTLIQKLPPEVIGQIAAGEVVERPAAAVKELVENSIDAGAKNITVELRDGGISLIRITDNGKGIPASQMRMAFERHATSKLRSAEELFSIASLGFRGEALASIAAVAKVTCISRTPQADFGARLIVEGGVYGEMTEAASPVGTCITVEKLFQNVPVRLKFLRKPAFEAGLVSDYMSRLILSHPEIAFRFVNNGKTIWRSVGDGKISSALYCLYGGEVFKKLLPVHGMMGGMVLDGYIGVDDAVYGNRQQQSFFVNGRYFRSDSLSHALEAGCAGRVMVGRYPLCALFLEMPYSQVDVNVHPNKLEVRFQNEGAVAELIENTVSEKLREDTLSAAFRAPANKPAQTAAPRPTIVIEEAAPAEKPLSHAEKPQAEPRTAESQATGIQKVEAFPPRPGPSVVAAAVAQAQQATRQAREDAFAGEMPLKPMDVPIIVKRSTPPLAVHETDHAPKAVVVMNPGENPSAKMAGNETSKEGTRELVNETPKEAPATRSASAPTEEEQPTPAEEQQSLLPRETEAPLRLIGVAFNTYWIFEQGDRLLLMDQHAAHERMLYDRYMRLYQNSTFSQGLLSPVLVPLSGPDLAAVQEYGELLANAGFEVEVFDGSHAVLRAIPMSFEQSGESPEGLLSEAIGELRAGRSEISTERLRMRVATMACRHAIKGGDALSAAETEAFLREFLRSESMPTCPHGRPIVTEISRQALEKKFKRIV